MPDRIRLLPEIVASQIAAGQVVIGPHSVVKEMMENSIDAGAHSVTVNIREGGHDLVQIVDDGCGMSPIDARMAFDHHATSKISTVDDIYALHTFGFRGEALASIAAVAQVEVRTRQADDPTGTVTTIHGGRFVAQEPAACQPGTQFMVRSLFYNIPVRRKSLPSPAESRNKVRAEFNRVALCYPELRFELYENDAPAMILEPSTLAGRIVDVVGRGVKQNLLEVSADTSIVRIAGFIGRPDAARRKGSSRYMFVNGRYFKSQYLYSAILKAYEKLIPDGFAPSYFLYFTVDPERVDVNMDAQKVDVRFADEAAVWSILSAAVRETLAKTGAVPMMEFNADDAVVEIPVARKGAVYVEPRANYNDAYNPFLEEQRADMAADGGAEHAARMYAARGDGGGVPARRASHRFDAAAGMEMIPSAEFDTFSSQTFGLEEPAGGASSIEFIEPENFVQAELPAVTAAEAPQPQFSRVTVIGPRYAVALCDGHAVTVDLKRASERVLYDAYFAMLSGGASATQRLLFPERLTLTNGDYALLAEHASEFAALGFDIEYSGGTTVDVAGTPADMPAERIDELIYELLRTMDTPHSAQDIRRERIAAVMARSGAHAAAEQMDHTAAAALLERLAATGNVSYSPAGKKIMAVLTPAEVKRKLE